MRGKNHREERSQESFLWVSNAAGTALRKSSDPAALPFVVAFMGRGMPLIPGSVLFLNGSLPDTGLDPHFFVSLFDKALMGQRLSEPHVIVQVLWGNLQRLAQMTRSLPEFRML